MAATQKEKLTFETWKYVAETYIDDNYSEVLLKSTIRKSLVGEAARHIRSQGDVTVSEIMATLELHYGEVECTSTTWKDFYGQSKIVMKMLHPGGYFWSRSYLRS